MTEYRYSLRHPINGSQDGDAVAYVVAATALLEWYLCLAAHLVKNFPQI